jgi:nucleotide-binding universal stress UspA family protein
MFTRFLVPLDGSRLAESVLPPARFMAECFHATIVLFHAIEQDAPATVHGQRHLATVDEASKYLKDIAARLAGPGVSVETNVHPVEQANVARSIIEHVSELRADLVFLCAHGHGGLRNVLVGGIAQQVISLGTTPVFFVRPQATEDLAESKFECHNALVPLDSTPIHEPALPIAEQIASVCGAALHLVTVVPTAGTLSAERAASGLLLPTTTAAVLDLAQRGAVEYLENLVAHLLAEGLSATAEVARGDPAPAILQVAEARKSDLIVMATHGRGNLDAFWSGSVTPKVLAKATAPVLLVRVTGEESARMW